MINWLQKFRQIIDHRFSFLEKVLIFWGLFWSSLGFSLYFLGLMNLFYRPLIISVVIGWILAALYLIFKFRFKLIAGLKEFVTNLGNNLKNDRLFLIIFLFLIAFMLLNLLSAIAPELGYDALWYHLALPKIYFMTHQIHYLPGKQFYYSVMPRLAEMIFAAGLAFDPSGILAKLIHYFFGLAWFAGIYSFGRLMLSRRTSFLTSLIIFGTIVVSWLSQTAYIDLIVSFFVVVSLINLFKFWQTNDDFYLVLSAVFMGLNLDTKIYGLIIFGILAIFLLFKSGWKKTLIFMSIALVLVLPFYLQAYLATGNPIFPVGSIRDSALDSYLAGYHSIKDWLLHAWLWLLPRLFWKTLIYSFTPFLGLIVFLPLIPKWRQYKLPLGIFLLFFIFWSIIPFQDLRYFLPILPLVALLIGFIFEKSDSKFFKIILLFFVFSFLTLNLVKIFNDYKKSFPIVLHQETTTDYLKANLPFGYNFYDIDGYFGRNIKSTDKVLTIDCGNLFYVNFSFYDWEFIKTKTRADSAEDLAKGLKSQGFTHVLIGSILNKTGISGWLDLPKSDVNRYFEIVYQNDFFKLYRIKQ